MLGAIEESLAENDEKAVISPQNSHITVKEKTITSKDSDLTNQALKQALDETTPGELLSPARKQRLAKLEVTQKQLNN